jgi:hypothetical protein
VILKPLDKQSLLSHPAITLNNQWVIFLDIFWFHGQPLLDHEKVFLQAATLFMLVESQHDI